MKLEEFVPTGAVVVPTGPRYHWYASGAVPPADTVKVAVLPFTIVIVDGWVVMLGATTG